jgi:hypothetical protein
MAKMKHYVNEDCAVHFVDIKLSDGDYRHYRIIEINGIVYEVAVFGENEQWVNCISYLQSDDIEIFTVKDAIDEIKQYYIRNGIEFIGDYYSKFYEDNKYDNK